MISISFIKFVVAVGVAGLAGVVGALFTGPAISSGWYAALAKPALNPPAWVFGPAWTTLYMLMGISLFLVWKQHSNIPFNSTNSGPFGLQNVRMLWRWRIGVISFFIQLLLNAVWSIIFFGFRSPGWALIEIVLLWFAIVWTMVFFYKISRPAVWLLAPYLLWVSFASYLNYSIWTLN